MKYIVITAFVVATMLGMSNAGMNLPEQLKKLRESNMTTVMPNATQTAETTTLALTRAAEELHHVHWHMWINLGVALISLIGFAVMGYFGVRLYLRVHKLKMERDLYARFSTSHYLNMYRILTDPNTPVPKTSRAAETAEAQV